MEYFEYLYQKGTEKTILKRIVIFGMVRDCGNAIRKNMKQIEQIASFFKDYRVVVFENNSKDNTKQVLKEWQRNNPKVIISLNDFDEDKYKSIKPNAQYFKYFQLNKLQKYYDYRNLMMEFLENVPFEADFSMLVDLDIERIDVKGVLSSFGTEIDWDAVTANGYSYSEKFKRRYHDTFALCEYGMEGGKQTLDMIRAYRDIFAFMRKGMPFIRVYSAYGGIAIYKTEAIRGLRYSPIFNDYGKVQVRCEHFSLYNEMAKRGYEKVLGWYRRKYLYATTRQGRSVLSDNSR